MKIGVYLVTVRAGVQNEVELPIGSHVLEVAHLPFSPELVLQGALSSAIRLRIEADTDQKRTEKRRFVLSGPGHKIPQAERDRTRVVGSINGLEVREIVEK